jgi:hypothetical protein
MSMGTFQKPPRKCQDPDRPQGPGPSDTFLGLDLSPTSKQQPGAKSPETGGGARGGKGREEAPVFHVPEISEHDLMVSPLALQMSPTSPGVPGGWEVSRKPASQLPGELRRALDQDIKDMVSGPDVAQVVEHLPASAKL